MNTVQRRSYGGAVSLGGGVLTNGAGVGETDPGIEPESSDPAKAFGGGWWKVLLEPWT